MQITSQLIPSTKGNLSAIINHPNIGTNDKLAILCPGYLDTKDYKHLEELAGRLSEEGYVVVRFDPTGTWESEGDTSDYTTTQYLEDIRQIINHMDTEHAIATTAANASNEGSQKAVQKDEQGYSSILLVGHSRGGQVAILYAARDPRITHVAAIMPSAGPMTGSRRDEWQNAGIKISKRDMPDQLTDQADFKTFSVPFSHVLDRDQYSALRDAHNIHVPILLIAGESDRIISIEEVESIFENANQPKDLRILWGASHDYRRTEADIIRVNNAIMEWLRDPSLNGPDSKQNNVQK